MENKLQELINSLCSGFITTDVRISHICDVRRFATMIHYAWKHDTGFHPDMFYTGLKQSKLFQSLPENELTEKSAELCKQADLVWLVFRAAFDIEKLSLNKL